MSREVTNSELLAEAKLLYSQLSQPRTPWDKLKHDNQRQKYLEIAKFTAAREKAHRHG